MQQWSRTPLLIVNSCFTPSHRLLPRRYKSARERHKKEVHANQGEENPPVPLVQLKLEEDSTPPLPPSTAPSPAREDVESQSQSQNHCHGLVDQGQVQMHDVQVQPQVQQHSQENDKYLMPA